MTKARSPEYPAIGLREAIEKVKLVYAKDYQHTVSKNVIAGHMGHKTLNGKSLGVLSALGKYGLLEGRGAESAVSALALKIIAHEKGTPERAAAIAEAAGKPKLFAKLDEKFPGGRASDAAIRSFLLTEKFIPEAADVAIRSYRETAELVSEDAPGYSGLLNVLTPASSGDHRLKPPARKASIGDYVQWTCGGQDMFKSGRRVEWVSEDGAYLRVFGEKTGIPMTEVTVTPPPMAPPIGAAPKSASSAYAGQDGELNVLLRGNRLEITADVDREGLSRLTEILGKYEEILKLIEPSKN